MRLPLQQIRCSRNQSSSSSYESYIKRTIPLVHLRLDNKKISVEIIDENIYVKIPESTISVESVVSIVSQKTGIPIEDLVLLDSQMVPISEGKGQLTHSQYN